MDYVNLGNSGLKVSRICLGCLSYGDPASGHTTWALNEADSRPFIKRAIELGINFFDTANMYSFGASEEVLGRALRDFTKRDDVVISTKVYNPMRKNDPNAQSLSRKAIFREIEDSLRRLGTDYVDIYQIHRWDPTTPIEETLEALHEVVKAGKARYIGASSMQAWQFAKALYLADLHGWTRFVSMQPHYNLIYREEEREMLDLCKCEGIAVLPWSPLAHGRLARPWKASETTARTKDDDYARKLYQSSEDVDRVVVEQVASIASARGIPMAQVALAWLLDKSVVTAPIIGATKLNHLEDAVATLSIKLTDNEVNALEKPYVPHRISN